jgi:hypothetical protein
MFNFSFGDTFRGTTLAVFGPCALATNEAPAAVVVIRKARLVSSPSGIFRLGIPVGLIPDT